MRLSWCRPHSVWIRNSGFEIGWSVVRIACGNRVSSLKVKCGHIVFVAVHAATCLGLFTQDITPLMSRLEVYLGCIMDGRLKRIKSNFVWRYEIFIQDIDRCIVTFFLSWLRLANIGKTGACNCFLSIRIGISSWHFRPAYDLNLLALRH